MIKNAFSFVLKSFKYKKARALLTIIGIFIGITAVVSLISIGEGMKVSVNEELGELGKNRILVAPGSGQLGPVSGTITTAKLTEDDLEVVCNSRGVQYCLGSLSKTKKITFKDESKFESVWGITLDSKSMEAIKEGRMFEVDSGKELDSGLGKKAVIGEDTALETFEKKIRIGNKILIEGEEFEVIGIQVGSSIGFGGSLVRIPMEEARDLFNETKEVSSIFVMAYESQDINEVKENIEKDMRRARDVKEGEEDFSVQTAEQNIKRLTDIVNLISIVLIGIAGISLVVGGVGIMNTMYTSVTERTKEIGIMKAVGATNWNVMMIFLVEAGLLGFFGGLLGLGFGFLIGKIVENVIVNFGIDIFKLYFSWSLILGTLFFSSFVGAMSGVFPAMQAAKLQPVEAFRKKL